MKPKDKISRYEKNNDELTRAKKKTRLHSRLISDYDQIDVPSSRLGVKKVFPLTR